MTATTLPDGHKHGHRHTYPSTYNTEIRQKRDARDHVSRARSRSAAGSRTSSTTTIDLATRTYNKVPPIIRTGAVKTAQDRVLSWSMHVYGPSRSPGCHASLCALPSSGA